MIKYLDNISNDNISYNRIIEALEDHFGVDRDIYDLDDEEQADFDFRITEKQVYELIANNELDNIFIYDFEEVREILRALEITSYTLDGDFCDAIYHLIVYYFLD